MRFVRVAVNVEQLLYRSPGGIGRYTAQLAAGLPRIDPGIQVAPFSARHPQAVVDAALRGAGIDSPGVALALPRPVLYEAWHSAGLAGPRRLSAALRQIDLVHAPSAATPPREGVPLVVSIHDAAPYLYPEAFPRRGLRFHLKGLASARRRADVVLTGSQVAAEEVAAYVGITLSRLRVVPYGVDPRPPAPERARELLSARGLADRPYVLWVGSLEPRKNVGTLVAAMARLRAGGPRSGAHGGGAGGAALVLAGYAGWLTEGLVDPTDRQVLGDALIQTGPVAEEELWALHGGATVTAVPSLHEGYGYPAVEAMACGVAVVASDIPVLREVTGDAATLVPATDVAAWAAAIEGLLGDPAQRARQAAAGSAVAAARTVRACLEGTAAVYREVTGAGSPGQAGDG
jgi:glycosyltransferase involved in cell wall biosynthesis